MLWSSMAFLPIIAIATRFDCETKLNDFLNWRNRVVEQLRVAVELKTNHHSELQYNCDLERKVKAGATSNRVLFVTFKNLKDVAANAGREMENLLSNSMLEFHIRMLVFNNDWIRKASCKSRRMPTKESQLQPWDSSVLLQCLNYRQSDGESAWTSTGQ